MKRTTYAEEHSEWVYDWPAILRNIEHGLFTEEEMREWQGASFSWVTCACGNQCAAISRHGRDSGLWEGTPRDLDMRRLGGKFHMSVCAALEGDQDAIAEARATLAAIEKRAAELLKEMGI